MTAITSRPLTDRELPLPASLLRFAVRADATVCAAVGLFVAMTADWLSGVTGLSATIEWISGAALVGYGALLYLLAMAPNLRRIGVGIAYANVAFVAASVAALAANWLALTDTGVALALAFTATTVVLAYLQYLGLRRLA